MHLQQRCARAAPEQRQLLQGGLVHLGSLLCRLPAHLRLHTSPAMLIKPKPLHICCLNSLHPGQESKRYHSGEAGLKTQSRIAWWGLSSAVQSPVLRSVMAWRAELCRGPIRQGEGVRSLKQLCKRCVVTEPHTAAGLGPVQSFARTAHVCAPQHSGRSHPAGAPGAHRLAARGCCSASWRAAQESAAPLKRRRVYPARHASAIKMLPPQGMCVYCVSACAQASLSADHATVDESMKGKCSPS